MSEKIKNYVELKHIEKSFGTFHASKDINISIEQGKLIALLGPSGSGKTTILKMIAGLETQDSGDIYINGKKVNDVPGSKRGVGFVFQNYALFRYMTVYDNIAFGLKVQKRSKEEIDKRVKELIKLIGCEGLEKRYPSQLSGGQRQRVAFARALAPEPELLLLDEPFAAIDAKVRLELRTWLRDIINKVGITSIFVTHDQDEAIEVADEIVVTNHGRIEQIGTPRELYMNPKTPFVAKFIGNSIELDNYNQFKHFAYAGEGSSAILRPEFISIFKKDENIQYADSTEKGIVEDLIFRGNSIEVRVRIHDELISSNRSITEPAIELGEEVGVFIYRLYIKNGDQIVLVDNESLNSESVVI